MRASVHARAHAQTIRYKCRTSISCTPMRASVAPPRPEEDDLSRAPWWTLELIGTSGSLKGCVIWVGWKTDRKRRLEGGRKRERGNLMSQRFFFFPQLWIGSHWSLENNLPPPALSFSNLPLLVVILLVLSTLELAFFHSLPKVIKISGQRTEVKVQFFPYWAVYAWVNCFFVFPVSTSFSSWELTGCSWAWYQFKGPTFTHWQVWRSWVKGSLAKGAACSS